MPRFDPRNPPPDVDKFVTTTWTVIPPRRDLGGPGSGNFGHAGRPGEVGGSAKGDATVAAYSPEERAVLEAEYEKLQANRAADAAYTHNKATHAEVHGRIAALVPNVYISEAKQTTITAASHVADVLEDMAARGYQLPDRVEVVLSNRTSMRGQIRFKQRQDEFKGQRWLTIEIPVNLPEDANLDDAAAATFGGRRNAVDIVTKAEPSTSESILSGGTRTTRKTKVAVKSEQEYDRFAVRNMNEVVIHEMGHVQAGPRGRALVGKAKGAVKNKAELTEAMRSVSLYAATSQDEFMAESFVRLNRGETLSPKAAKLYKKWNGPAIVTKVMPLSYRERLAILSLGGEGSGNFGHAGRPGEVGGSGAGTATEDHVTALTDQPSPATFKREFDAAFKDSPYKAFVSHYTEDEIAGMTRIMKNDGKTGVLVHDHNDGRIEATALYNRSTVKGAGRALLKEAIDHHGVNYVECYGGTLDTIYRDLGFETTEQYPFDDAQASPDWDYARFDRPDYHIMRLKTPASTDLSTDAATAAGLTDLETLKARAKAKADPEWWAQYGEASWKAALAVMGEPVEETP